MKLSIDNGWRGSIDGIATDAALTLLGDDGSLVIPRSAVLRVPRTGDVIAHELGDLTVLSGSADGTNLVLSVRRKSNG